MSCCDYQANIFYPSHYLLNPSVMVHYNPSLREEDRDQPAAVVPFAREASILDWLEQSDRLLPREEEPEKAPRDEEEEISALMGDSSSFSEDDDDDDDDLDLDD